MDSVGYTIVAIHLEFGLDFGFHHVAFTVIPCFCFNPSLRVGLFTHQQHDSVARSYPLHSEQTQTHRHADTQAKLRNTETTTPTNKQVSLIYCTVAPVFTSISSFLEDFAGLNLKKHVWGLSETSSEAYFIRIPQGG
jgi:hypothetical protein